MNEVLETVVENNEIVTEAAEAVAKKGGSLVKTCIVFVAGVLTGVGGTLFVDRCKSKRTATLPRKRFWEKEEDFVEENTAEDENVDSPEEENN